MTVPLLLRQLCKVAKARKWNLMDLTLRLNQTWEELFPEDE